MYLFTTVPHPHGHWQLQELLGNIFAIWGIKASQDMFSYNLNTKSLYRRMQMTAMDDKLILSCDPAQGTALK